MLRQLIITAVLVCGGQAIGGPLADRGIAEYERADWTAAASTLRRALDQEKLSAGDRVRLQALLATSLVGSGQEVAAEQAFAQLLEADPSYRPFSDISPKVKEVFQRALAGSKRAAPPPVPVYKKWWLWTAVAGGALVIAVGAGVGASVSQGGGGLDVRVGRQCPAGTCPLW